MHWLDIVLIVILAILLFDGWRHGLLHYVFDFVGLGLGILAAVLFHDALAGKLGRISTSGVAEIVAFVIICAVVGIAVAVPGHILLEPRIKREISSRVNRGGGIALGFIIGAALCVVIVLLMNKFAVSSPGTPLEEPSGIRQCITTALDESFFAGLILKCFGSLL
jgi:membrane protein required for colicin V production